MPGILFLMSETGGGHRSAAEAITAALQRSAPEVPVAFLDFFAACAPLPLNRPGGLYRAWVRYAPWLWGAAFHLTNGRRRVRPVLWGLNRLLLPCLAQRVQEIAPEVLVCVHPLVTHAAAEVRRRHLPTTPLVTVVTDLVSTHAAWFCPQADLCIVPTEAAARRAIDAGMPREKLRLIGLPVHSRFTQIIQRPAEVRRALGLDPERFTVLLVGGGEGMGRVYEMACAIADAGINLQQIVIAGRNAQLRRRLEARRWAVPTRVFGFVETMPTLMQAADVVVTKAGPSTICESLVVGRPLLLFGYVPGQERGNVDFVVQGGAGWLTQTPEALVQALRRLAAPESPDRMRMLEHARRLARPAAAEEIAHVLLGVLRRDSNSNGGTVSPPQGVLQIKT